MPRPLNRKHQPLSLKTRHVSILDVLTLLHLSGPAFTGFASTGGLAAAESTRATMPLKDIAVFEKYFFDCHDSGSKEGGINLQELPLDIASDIRTP